jgi:integrase
VIKRAPLKTDPPGKCSRWWVKIYNAETHKPEWHTVHGTRKEAEAYERVQKDKLSKGTFVARIDRKTLQDVYELFMRERRARDRRASTLREYESSLTLYVLPKFGAKDFASLKKNDVKNHLYGLREAGKTAATVNKVIRAWKALMNFGLDSELTDRNPLQRFKPFERRDGERTVNRDSFTEAEVRALLDAAPARDRALIGLLVFTGMRPGEMYALDWQSVSLEEGRVQIRRNWDYKARVFNPPKTAAGKRNVPLSPWVVAQLRDHRAVCGNPAPDALVFPTREGTPMNPSNVRRDIWLPLKGRAGVRNLDMYSMRHTFVTFAMAEGAEAFNVARAIGHAKSEIVAKIYGNHTLESGVAPISANVTARALGEEPQPPSPAPPAPKASEQTPPKQPEPTAAAGAPPARARPQLVTGGRRSSTGFMPGRRNRG